VPNVLVSNLNISSLLTAVGVVLPLSVRLTEPERIATPSTTLLLVGDITLRAALAQHDDGFHELGHRLKMPDYITIVKQVSMQLSSVI
jgi:hypothetical protein